MADIKTPEARSYNMSQIRGKDTKPELIVRKFLFRNGFRYRIHNDKLPGKPDIVLPKYKTVIFVNGCFWHGHTDCKYFKIPTTNKEFWINKIDRTKEKDLENIENLKMSGYRVITIWECELRNRPKREKTLTDLLEVIISANISQLVKT